MSGRFSKSEIDRLGERIRAARTLSAEDLRALQAWRDEREVALLDVKEMLGELGFRATARLKTHNTIIEKLRRQQDLRLSRVQDVAGCRIVVRGGRAEQDRTVEQILGRYPDTRLVDRRLQPSQGYRAVHLIVAIDGWPVEIQVRTALQDAWAQAFEQFADLYGRSLRYGGPPAIHADDGPWQTRWFLAPVVRWRVRRWERQLHRLSAEIDRIERAGSGHLEQAVLARLAAVQRRARSLYQWWSPRRPT